MQTFYGYRRLTHRYNDGWKHLDNEEYVGLFGILKTRRTEPENEDGNYRLFHTVKVPRLVKPELIEQTLRDHFRWSCRCEHDCCGCSFGYATRVRRVKRRNWVVEVSVGYNI